MSDRPKGQAPDTRPAYDPPRAMRLSEVHAGAGECVPGSGDAQFCYFSGNGALGECLADGSGDTVSCYSTGNAATGFCISNGAGVIL